MYKLDLKKVESYFNLALHILMYSCLMDMIHLNFLIIFKSWFIRASIIKFLKVCLSYTYYIWDHATQKFSKYKIKIFVKTLFWGKKKRHIINLLMHKIFEIYIVVCFYFSMFLNKFIKCIMHFFLGRELKVQGVYN